ncbi:hypothetical protein N7470_005591 [Penicillium chermesinum]|nr:hypothetical protein N7470_005591 [Penicillium chermesinum]
MSSSASEPDLAQALADVAKGEMTASALENHLSALEDKMDELLALFDGQDVNLRKKQPSHDQETENGYDTNNGNVMKQK